MLPLKTHGKVCLFQASASFWSLEGGSMGSRGSPCLVDASYQSSGFTFSL